MITTNKKRLMNFAGHIKIMEKTKNLKWQKKATMVNLNFFMTI